MCRQPMRHGTEKARPRGGLHKQLSRLLERTVLKPFCPTTRLILPPPAGDLVVSRRLRFKEPLSLYHSLASIHRSLRTRHSFISLSPTTWRTGSRPGNPTRRYNGVHVRREVQSGGGDSNRRVWNSLRGGPYCGGQRSGHQGRTCHLTVFASPAGDENLQDVAGRPWCTMDDVVWQVRLIQRYGHRPAWALARRSLSTV